ncbi:MAG: hypothetical protein QXZ09_05575 [Candidatus Methanomethylicaceae archaeon]
MNGSSRLMIILEQSQLQDLITFMQAAEIKGSDIPKWISVWNAIQSARPYEEAKVEEAKND